MKKHFGRLFRSKGKTKTQDPCNGAGPPPFLSQSPSPSPSPSASTSGPTPHSAAHDDSAIALSPTSTAVSDKPESLNYAISSTSRAKELEPAPSVGSESPPQAGSQAPASETATATSPPDELWDEAYDRLKQQEPDLIEKYEKIATLSLSACDDAASRESPYDNNTVPAHDKAARQRQMLALSRVKMERFREREQTLENVAMAIQVVDNLLAQVATALEASPPAALAFAGLHLILAGCGRGIAASQDCIKGLSRVVSRIEWYIGLAGRIFRGSGRGTEGAGPSLEASRTQLQSSLRGSILDLFTSLVRYQARSACAYYRANKLATFLGDLVRLNDWGSWMASIETAERDLLRDVDTYNQELAKELAGKLATHAKESEGLLRALVRHSGEAAERDARRERREERQWDQATRTRINKLISTFSIPGLNYREFKDRLNPKLAPNTGLWVRNHSKYMDWETQESGILLLAAPPGCGKSVLARSIVDHWTKEAAENGDVVCYFFFKDAPSQRSLSLALCAVLHQLFVQREEAVLEVCDDIERCRPEQLCQDPRALWELFAKAATALGSSVDIKCVFDALDEAEDASWSLLINLLDGRFNVRDAGGPRARLARACSPGPGY